MAPAASSGSSSWTQVRYGLPTWAWVGVGGLALAGVYVFVRGYRNAAASKSPASSSSTQQPATQGNAPLIIPLAGPPGQSITGAKGDTGATGATGAAGAPGAPGSPGVPRPVPLPILQPAPMPAPPSQPRTYTVQGGDTLTAIVAREWPGHTWQDLFSFGGNASTIEQWARERGQWNPSDPGHWIYPSEQLQLPAAA